MVQVLLIDDEYYVREALKTSVPWHENGFCICGEAEDGEEAWNKLLALKPDIALVDINMPIMDGLTIVKKIKENNLKTKVIILTGYSKFEYAKQAVELGTCYYLLKPIVEDELLTALLDIKETILKENKQHLQIHSLKNQVKKSQNLLKEKFLNQLISDTSIFQKENLVSTIESLNIPLVNTYYRMIIFKIDHIYEKGWYVRDKELWGFALKNICYEIINKHYTCELWFDYDDNLCCLMMDEKELQDSKLKDIGSKIQIMVYRLLQFTISVGIGNGYLDISSIKSSYNEAVVSLKNKITNG